MGVVVPGEDAPFAQVLVYFLVSVFLLSSRNYEKALALVGFVYGLYGKGKALMCWDIY